jgi:hypothetical protein
MDNEDEEVGYCAPPKKHRFQKGQSGNPRGRPKKPLPQISLDIGQIIRRLDAELVQLGDKLICRREAELRKLQELEIKDDKRARRLLHKLRSRRPTAKGGGVIRSTELWMKAEEKSRNGRGRENQARPPIDQ